MKKYLNSRKLSLKVDKVKQCRLISWKCQRNSTLCSIYQQRTVRGNSLVRSTQTPKMLGNSFLINGKEERKLLKIWTIVPSKVKLTWQAKTQLIRIYQCLQCQHQLEANEQQPIVITVEGNQSYNSSSTSSASSVGLVDENDSSFNPPGQKKKSRSPLITLQVPVSQISKCTNVPPVADRCGLSVQDHVLVTSSFIVNSGGSPEDFPLSSGTFHRHRLEAREEISNQQFEQWQKNEKPEYPGLHFDSKMIELLTGEKQERLAVIISGALTGY